MISAAEPTCLPTSGSKQQRRRIVAELEAGKQDAIRILLRLDSPRQFGERREPTCRAPPPSARRRSSAGRDRRAPKSRRLSSRISVPSGHGTAHDASVGRCGIEAEQGHRAAFLLALPATAKPVPETRPIRRRFWACSRWLSAIRRPFAISNWRRSGASPTVTTSPSGERTKAVVSAKVQTSRLVVARGAQRHGADGPGHEIVPLRRRLLKEHARASSMT